MNCPRCKGEKQDPEMEIMSQTVCCGVAIMDCGGEGCTGPQEMQEPCPHACALCAGTGFVLAREALAYSLTEEV